MIFPHIVWLCADAVVSISIFIFQFGCFSVCFASSFLIYPSNFLLISAFHHLINWLRELFKRINYFRRSRWFVSKLTQRLHLSLLFLSLTLSLTYIHILAAICSCATEFQSKRISTCTVNCHVVCYLCFQNSLQFKIQWFAAEVGTIMSHIGLWMTAIRSVCRSVYLSIYLFVYLLWLTNVLTIIVILFNNKSHKLMMQYSISKSLIFSSFSNCSISLLNALGYVI